MSAVAEGEADAPSKPVVLHLVGGDLARGGLMSFVRDITREPLPGFDQFVWKYRKYASQNEAILPLGWSKSVDRNIIEDAAAAALDAIPLYLWLRKRKGERVILHAHSRMGTILCEFISLARPLPVVVHAHAQWRRTLLHRVLWRLTRATVVFNSRQTCLHFGFEPRASHIIPPPIRWPTTPSPGNGRFVASSQILRWKNVHLIIEAFLKMAKESQTLHIYGFSADPAEIDYQNEIVRRAKPHPNIFLHQWDSSWTESLGSADIFVHAAEKEPFGIVLLEAYARGCRMAVPHGTFLDELPASGIFQSVANSGSLAAAMSAACDFPTANDLWRERQSVAHLFSVENARQELSRIYRAKLNSA